MKKSGKMSMVGNMTKVESVPARDADALLYDLPAQTTMSSRAETPSPMKEMSKAKVPFTNQLTPETFLRLKQFECWGGMEIQDILEEALTAFFADKPEANRELPPKAKEKLKKKIPNMK
ncbi:hypothetical protein [Hymenobacter rubidus]|uniref:hypothetical protein n=1 Tax=Hymenobacter rubidus TaxID=1441626 RepID=UPI00191F1A3E|nr:hypothetical protein [Hymenobacter rubidus]